MLMLGKNILNYYRYQKQAKYILSNKKKYRFNK